MLNSLQLLQVKKQLGLVPLLFFNEMIVGCLFILLLKLL